ncbi:MAG: crosslink repair DNA glycosylase YcaQ family protein [Bryobacteraceae bacterium]
MAADLSLAEARRIAIAAQGLAASRPKRATAKHIGAAIGRLRLVQLDFVNVVAPAHEQVVFSRTGAFSRETFQRAVYGEGALTEQWAHEASIVPMASYPLLAYRRATHRVRPWGFEKFLAANAAYAQRVFDAVVKHGPLTASEAPQPDGDRRIAGDWTSSVARATLESFFGRGDLAVAGRRSDFARIYDLAERVIPAAHRERAVDRLDSQRELLRQAAGAHGVATARDLADYFRMPMSEARPRIAELLEQGDVSEVTVEGWREKAYLARGAEPPRRVDARALLSPFDPLIWFRPRTERLFGFHYRVEIYVPEERRRWGYYVLPLLLGDRLAARVDLRADRGAGVLRVMAAHLEPGEKASAVREALGVELRAMSEWLGLGGLGRIPAFR